MDMYKWASVSDQWTLVAKALEIADRVYLWGAPGLGKSFAAIHKAAKGRPIENQTLHEDLSTQELMGFWAPSPTGAKWIDGPIIKSMREGGLLILNELHRASPAVHDFLLAILDSDDSRMVTIPSGETVVAAKGFKVIATANEGPSVLTPALSNRFEVLMEVTQPSPEMVRALDSQYKGLGTLVANSFSGKSIGTIIHPRRAFSFMKLVKGGMDEKQAALSVFGGDEQKNLPTEFLNALKIIHAA